MVETNIRTFAGNWTGTGSISGTGDAEVMCLDTGEEMVSEVIWTDTYTMEVAQNYYNTGDALYLYYRHGATEVACEAAAWNVYSIPFMSLGYVQIRAIYEAP